MSEYLMLAKHWRGIHVDGWLCSEKLDGMRAFWDGGVGRGKNPPWSADKIIGTGLWSRYGKVVRAPDWWLDNLPNICLDGELYVNGGWSDTLSVTRAHNANWHEVTYNVFDSPHPSQFAQRRLVANNIITLELAFDHEEWWPNYEMQPVAFAGLKLGHVANDVVKVVKQTSILTREIQDQLEAVVANGGEGLILRHPMSQWSPCRSKWLLKVKPIDTSEGKIIGYTKGKGKYEGLLGALVIEWEDVTFNLSGMTDTLRHVPPPIGASVRFRHRGVTVDGIPREARYVGLAD